MTSEEDNAAMHQRCWELLPWHVNGSLDAEESASVETHLKACLVCRRELRSLQDLGRAVHGANGTELAVEEGLSEVLARIDALEPPGGPALGWSARAYAALRGWGHQHLRTAPAVRLTLAAQLVVVLSLLGLLIWTPPPAPQPAFVTLSSPQPGTAPERARVRLAFADGTSEEALRGLLRELGARIVDGPDAEARYTVELPLPPAAAVSGSPLLQRLGADPRVASIEAELAGSR